MVGVEEVAAEVDASRPGTTGIYKTWISRSLAMRRVNAVRLSNIFVDVNDRSRAASR